MKLKIVNYRRFIFMAVLCSLVLFLFGWGLVYGVSHFMIKSETPVSGGRTVTRETGNTAVAPDNLNSPYLIVVSASSPIDASYEPTDLVQVNITSDTPLRMTSAAATAIQNLFTDIQAQGIDLKAISAYRSYSDQQALYNAELNVTGYVTGVESVTGGQSEHQTGLAIDVSSSEANYGLDDSFANTKAGQWLVDNSYKYGFIIRYPKGKEIITENVYQPWHLRYVGVDDATKITENNLTLEEYTKNIPG